MLIVDAGFLFALADATDRWHDKALSWAATAAQGWVTTWPVVAETCHLLTTRLHPAPALRLLEDIGAGGLEIWTPPVAQASRMAGLMRQYAKLPMDLADASLVLLAEHLGHGRILSTDQRDFGTYRWKSREPFVNLLEDA